MTRFVLLALAFTVTSTAAIADRCPVGIAIIDRSLQAPEFPDYERLKFSEYRQQAEALHRTGRHAEALEVLSTALDQLNHLR